MGGRPTHRHRARGRHRGARRAGREFPPDQAHQRGRDPPSHRPEGAAALRVPDGRRGRAAPGARGARHRDHGAGRAHRPSGADRGVHVSLELQLVLLAWGTLVGLDLISVPQMMIARPIVAGPVAGAILGDVETGLALGVVFELFQYDVLPVGAAGYPEYGPATVAAVSAAQAGAGTFGLGFGVLVGLTTGLLGGVSLHLVHRLNARAVDAAAPALEAGDPQVLVRLHVAGIMRDAARAALVTGVGLILAQLTRAFLAGAYTLRGVAGLAVAGVAGGAPRGAARPPRPGGGGARPPPAARRARGGPGGSGRPRRPPPGRTRC